MIKAIDVTYKIPERFNLFEYLENDNEFIKCKSQNNQTLKKVCGKREFFATKKNDFISCKRNDSTDVIRLTNGDICRDLQFLKFMNYPNKSISYVEKELYDGKKKL